MYVYIIEAKAPFILQTFVEKLNLHGAPLWRRDAYIHIQRDIH